MSGDPPKACTSPGEAGGQEPMFGGSLQKSGHPPQPPGRTEKCPQGRPSRTLPPVRSQETHKPPAHEAGDPRLDLPTSAWVEALSSATEKHQVTVLHKGFLREEESRVCRTFPASARSLQLRLVPRDPCEGPPTPPWGRRGRLGRDAVPGGAPCLPRGWGLLPARGRCW